MSSTPTLENTYWKLTRLGDAAIGGASADREPHVILHPDDRSVSGSGGCNRLAGGYELSSELLTFGRLATTMMACIDGMETEGAFLAALAQASGWAVTGQELALLDAAGTEVARFEAVDLR